jgi:hypothetical protein
MERLPVAAETVLPLSDGGVLSPVADEGVSWLPADCFDCSVLPCEGEDLKRCCETFFLGGVRPAFSGAELLSADGEAEPASSSVLKIEVVGGSRKTVKLQYHRNNA